MANYGQVSWKLSQQIFQCGNVDCERHPLVKNSILDFPAEHCMIGIFRPKSQYPYT